MCPNVLRHWYIRVCFRVYVALYFVNLVAFKAACRRQ